MPPLAPIGAATVGASAAAGMTTAQLATVGAITTASTVGSVASGVAGIVNATKGSDSTPVAFSANQAKKKIGLSTANSIRKMAQSQTETVLTAPLGVAQTILGN